MSDSIKHECGVAMLRLLKPLEFYQKKYGSTFYGLNKMYLLMEKQHNRGQDGVGLANVKLDIPAGKRYISRKRSVALNPIQDVFNQVNKRFIQLENTDPDKLKDPNWMKDNLPFTGELFLGHLRYGTYGSNTIEQCHPFLRQNNWKTRKNESATVELQVCKNCLKSLNYKNFSRNFNVFGEFSISDFFATYSSFFASLPSRSSGEEDGSYTDDWQMVSAKYRASRNYSCESCGVDLSKNKQLLHTHHKSGVKTNNKSSNLQALCIDCHRKQSNHDHLFVHHEDMVMINHLRRDQGQLKEGRWSDVFEFSDSALHGLLAKCEHNRVKNPVVAYEILGDMDEIVAELELAWPKSKNCIVIRKDDAVVAREHGWHVWTMIEAMDDFSQFKRSVY